MTTTTVRPARHAAARARRARPLVGGVELAGRLVGEHERRSARVRRGDRHPLLLAAGQRARAVRAAISEAERGQRGIGGAAWIWVSGQADRRCDVLARRQRRPQVVALEHERELARPVGGQLALVESLKRARRRRAPRRPRARRAPRRAPASCSCRSPTDRARRPARRARRGASRPRRATVSTGPER